MAPLGVTREYSPGSCLKLRKTSRLTPHREMKPHSTALPAEKFLVPNQTWKEPWFAWWNYREYPKTPYKSRRTVMSPQECQLALCSPNQLEMMTDSPGLSSEESPIPHHTGKVAWLPLGNSRDSLRNPSHVYRNTNFSTGTQGKLHASHIISRRELIPRILLKR